MGDGEQVCVGLCVRVCVSVYVDLVGVYVRVRRLFGENVLGESGDLVSTLRTEIFPRVASRSRHWALIGGGCAVRTWVPPPPWIHRRMLDSLVSLRTSCTCITNKNPVTSPITSLPRLAVQSVSLCSLLPRHARCLHLSCHLLPARARSCLMRHTARKILL